MFPVLQIGPLALQTPGLFLLVGLWIGLNFAEKNAKRYGIQPGDLDNLILLALVAGVLGARLTYILRYPVVFSANPASIISLNPGLLDPWGGLVAAGLAALIYGQRKKLPFWPTLDALTPAFAVMGVALGLSHLASGSAYGAPADLPWAIELWGAERHPSQVYEILAALLILAVVWPEHGLWDRYKGHQNLQPGVRFLGFVALSAFARLFLEAFRGDSTLLGGGIRSAQLLAWLVLFASLWGIRRLQHRAPGNTENLEKLQANKMGGTYE